MKTVVDAPIKNSKTKSDYIDRSKADNAGSGILRFMDNRPDTLQKMKLQEIIEKRQTISGFKAKHAADMAQNRVIQRLMSYDTFKEETSVTGSRRKKSRIHKLDQALKAFDPTADLPKRIDAYRTIYLEGKKYLDIPEEQKAKRKTGVTKLMTEVLNEVTALLEPTLAAAEAVDVVAFDDKWNKTKDAARVIDCYKHVLNQDAAAPEARLEVLHQVMIGRDVAKLEAIGGDESAPEVTRDIVKEIMANKADIKFEESMPGATRVKGGAKPYKVKHSLEQPGGEAERIGSLAHEMTHVAVGKTFDNSMLLFSFAKDASDEALLALIDQRHKNVAALDTSLGQANLNKAQTDLVKSKLKYASGGKVGHYLSTFLSAKKISKEEAAAIKAKIERVGLDNTVIEYDSVVNQILVYLHLWEIPQDNPLYVKVLELAKQAYDRRQAMKAKAV